MKAAYGFLFLLSLKIKNKTRPTIATTTKIPTPMPALKIPSTRLHELIKQNRNELINSLSVFNIFIAINF